MDRRQPFADGYDPVGPFHPYVVFAAVLAIDLMAVMLVLAALTYVGDKLEDAIWPGGPEWVDL